MWQRLECRSQVRLLFTLLRNGVVRDALPQPGFEYSCGSDSPHWLSEPGPGRRSVFGEVELQFGTSIIAWWKRLSPLGDGLIQCHGGPVAGRIAAVASKHRRESS